MRNIKLTIEYDGTEFHGWQKQPLQRTIQEEIEKAISKITKENINIIGAGRTDRGVHAKGQTANFYTFAKIPASKFKLAINSVLPREITVSESEEVDEGFHSRYSATGKEYSYLIYNNRVRTSLLRNYSYHIPYEIDINKMKNASNDFIGTYDFRSFMSTGSGVKDTVRRIDSLTIKKENNIVKISVKGNGFLYNMVRIIVGTLVDIGRGKLEEDKICYIIQSKNREHAGHTAPPQGLYLEKVFFKS